MIAAASGADRADRPDLSAGLWINASAAASAAGEFDRAEEFSRRAEDAVRGTGLKGLLLLVLSARAYLFVRTDRLEEAAEAARACYEVADDLDEPTYLREAQHTEALVALAAGDHERAADLFLAALAGPAAISRPRARLARAEALAQCGRSDEAEAELRETALEPVGPADFPDTLVARLTRVQGLIAAARGERDLAAKRLNEAAAGWRRINERGRRGDRMNAVFADLGRPAIGLVEPERELARIETELAELAGKENRARVP
jgi:tetratricopeptide (TPR) repeat protein